ncbi:19140_t:CDS:2, partial [Dentiscutata erythropus]
MSTRTFKKLANEKLNTNTANKQGCKKKKVVTSLSLNDNDDPLDSIDNSKSKKSKKLHIASYEKNDATVTSYKKNQNTVTPVVDNQTIDNILNSFDDSIEPNHNDKDIDDFNSTLISAPLRPSVTRAITTSIFNDDFIPSNRPAFCSLIPASSGSLQALNSDNSFMLNTPNIPSAFREMTIYQLCLWLCKNQNVLQLTNSMNISMQSSVVDGSLFTSQLLPITSQLAIQNDKIKAGHDFLEELKCTSTLPKKENVDKFIDEKKMETVLQRWLNATKMDELKAENSLFYLCQFIKKAFIINYIARDPEKTKTLDSITKNIVVPSQNRKNFANNLH